ncbi:NAD(P)H-dependent oxidoreductase [Orbus wheelerorum]|uniref:NAD(P)H-dependent oxidoreductase n=1 Tax=Orbus wheelerorum TaxID=3074111 RepID=UPI00370D5972
MNKTLIIVAHPNMQDSVINKRWIKELALYPEKFTIHDLYSTYPDEQINVEQEQALIESHDNLVLQFPIYWFNCTPLLKKWLDEVFTYGWAYGSKGKKLMGKKIALAVSLGSKKEEYQEPFTLTNLLRPFEATINYVNGHYQGAFTLYGTHTEPDKVSITQQIIEQNAKDYVQFLSDL